MNTRDGKAVKAARQALRLKQSELADICSLRAETLSRIEGGKDSVPGYVEMILSLLERDEEAVRFAIRKAAEK